MLSLPLQGLLTASPIFEPRPRPRWISAGLRARLRPDPSGPSPSPRIGSRWGAVSGAPSASTGPRLQLATCPFISRIPFWSVTATASSSTSDRSGGTWPIRLTITPRPPSGTRWSSPSSPWASSPGKSSPYPTLWSSIPPGKPSMTWVTGDPATRSRPISITSHSTALVRLWLAETIDRTGLTSTTADKGQRPNHGGGPLSFALDPWTGDLVAVNQFATFRTFVAQGNYEFPEYFVGLMLWTQTCFSKMN